MANETNPHAQLLKRLLSEREAADILNVKPNTLAAWRCTKRVEGPRYVKMGGAVRYPMAELEAFIARQLVTE